MDHHRHSDAQHHRSTASLITPQKLNIAYLLNDPTADDKSDGLMREAASSRDLRAHRKSMAGSSRRLHVNNGHHHHHHHHHHHNSRDHHYHHHHRPSSSSTDVHSSSSSSAGQQHQSQSHSHQQTAHYYCALCNEAFDQISLFEEHKRSHHQNGQQVQSSQRAGRSFACHECNATFGEKGNLNRKEKPFICPHCNNHFAFRDALNRHVDAVHLGLRPYECLRCDAKFKKRAHLQRHMSTCHKSEAILN